MKAHFLAAEQRPAVAHNASYGKPGHPFPQAPAGAIEKHPLIIHFFRPIRGLKTFADTIPTAGAVGY